MQRKFKALGLLPFLLCLHFEAAAVGPTIESVTGASGSQLTGTITVFGGVAGPACSDPGNIVTCNNCKVADLTTCAQPPLCMCNTARIYDNLVVRLNLKPPTASTGNAVVKRADGTDFPPRTLANGGTYVDFTWGTICAAIGGTCEALAPTSTATTLVLRIHIDANNDGNVTGEDATEVTFKVLAPPANYDVFAEPSGASVGIGAFTPYPGDGKVFLENPQTASGFPTFSYGSVATKATKTRVFISDVDMSSAHVESTLAPEDLAVVDNGANLAKNLVDGLDNGTRYYFRVALVDEGANVLQYFPDNQACATTPGEQCVYSAVPDAVEGMLKDDFNCFVATAAYGTSLEPKLKTFREFRYKILLRSSWGRAFVHWYYKFGPFAARFIEDKSWARQLTQVLLWPLYAFSYVALKLGFIAAFVLVIALCSALIGLPWLGLRKANKRG